MQGGPARQRDGVVVIGQPAREREWTEINRAMMTVAVRTCTERGSGRWIGEGATGPPVRHRAPPRAFLESFLFTGASGFLS